MSNLYDKRGVSAQKEDVHKAIANLKKGLFNSSFCQVYPDILGGDENFVNIIHADGAGTKTILSYLYWKQTGDLNIWQKVAQDAIVMNLDDLLCVGIYDNILFNSTIDRNKLLISGDVLKSIIDGTNNFFENIRKYGINIYYGGGETADVGDVVKTISVNGTMTARWPKNKIITNEKISAGNVIVGLAGYGQAIYENEYNSGIGSNGLTGARHDVLSKFYAENFKEAYDLNLNTDVVYNGKYLLTDTYTHKGKSYRVVDLLASPTRTYAPFIKKLLENNFNAVNGLIHCSGGGQTKCLKFMPQNTKIIKDNLFEIPPVFSLIEECTLSDKKEMFEVFNMGCRLEIYTQSEHAQSIIDLANSFNIDAQIIGRVEKSTQEKPSLSIVYNEETFSY